MSNYKDLEKRRETTQKWRDKNREKLREYSKAKYGAKYKQEWRAKNPERSAQADKNSRKWTAERQREYMREYYQKNKERMSAQSKEYYEANREEKIKYAAEWREKNMDKFRASRKLRRDVLFEWWYGELLPSLKCSHCGMNDPDCMDFHHKVMRKPGEKRRNPTTMLYSVCSRATIESEIAKCIVLCANCHRKEHARLRREQVSR